MDDTGVIGGTELAALAQLAFALAGLARKQMAATRLAEQHLAVLRLFEALGQALARFMFHFVAHKKLRSSVRASHLRAAHGAGFIRNRRPAVQLFSEKITNVSS